MSIIHEALKKAQNSLRRNSPSSVPASLDLSVLDPTSSAPAAKKETRVVTILLLIIFVLLIGAIAFFIFIFFFTPAMQKILPQARTETPKAVVAPPPVVPPPPEAVLPDAQTAAADPDKPVLNGTIMSGKEPLALINNQILKVGDSIDGKKIMSIAEGKVELASEEGRIVVLTVQSQP